MSALGRNALHLQGRLVDLFASLPKLPSGHARRFYPSGEPPSLHFPRLSAYLRVHRIRYRHQVRFRNFSAWWDLRQTDKLYLTANALSAEKPHQNKLRTREHVEQLAKQGKIEFTYIVTGPFLDTFIFARAGGRVGFNRQNGTYAIVGSENRNEQATISGTTYADTGRCEQAGLLGIASEADALWPGDVLSSLLTPEASANATLRVSSVDAKPADFQSALEKLEGNKSFKTSYTSIEDFKALEKEAWDKSDPSATVYTLSRIWYDGQSDFTRKPRALYLQPDGTEAEKPELASQLFKDVPKRELEDVLKGLL